MVTSSILQIKKSRHGEIMQRGPGYAAGHP